MSQGTRRCALPPRYRGRLTIIFKPKGLEPSKPNIFKITSGITPIWISFRSISNHQLNTLLYLHLGPIYLVVFKGSYLIEISHLEGGFTLRCLQRLSLPDLATLPCRWSTTDTPVVRPSRSSRTKDSSSQISSARAG